MKIVFDLNRCLGYAQCIPLAPKALQLYGEEAVMYDPNPDDSMRQQILRAAASCPGSSIKTSSYSRVAAKTASDYS